MLTYILIGRTILKKHQRWRYRTGRNLMRNIETIFIDRNEKYNYNDYLLNFSIY